MPHLRSKGFVVAALVSLAALPVTQWWSDHAAGRPWTGAMLWERLPTAAHLRAVEQEQQQAATRNGYVQALAAAPGLAWLRGADSPVLPVRGLPNHAGETWLFYRPDARLISQRPDEGVARRASAATIHWRDQLAARGIRLVVVVAPNKAAVQRLGRHTTAEVWRSPELQGYQAALAASHVEVVDLHAVYAAVDPQVSQKTPLYLPTDTHWSSVGLDLAAHAIVTRLGWLPRAGAYGARSVSLPHVGDLERWRGPTPEPRPEVVTQVTDAQGKAVSPRPGEAEVLLIGDSFSRIFEVGDGPGAGLRSQLARRLGRPVALVQQDGGGATLVRQELARRPEWLRSVKVVVWEFAERDLTSPDAEWSPVELPR